MYVHRTTFLLALLVSLAGFAANEWFQRMPPVVPATAPADQFSADRAFALESRILSEGVPHPNGSDANHRVRERIEQFLNDNGIPYDIQRTWGCAARFNRCAWVENIIARVDGDQPGHFVAIEAHYDSVPMAPGAADDGAGFTTALETARILKAEGHHKNPLLLILTDAEEDGLLGAEAFYAQSPLAKQVGIVINIEAAGSTGRSQVLRTGGHNAHLISLYQKVALHPVATSLTDEIFKHMPNDTDFSVAKRHDVPGIDFAFAGEFSHYHTPNDSLDNLDKRSLQSHGDNILPLARALVNANLAEVTTGMDDVYMQVLGVWLQWPVWFSWVLLAFAGLMLIVVLVREHSRTAGWRQWIGAIGIPLVTSIATIGTGVIAFKVVSLLVGTINPWPAVLWPWRLVLFCAPLAGGLLVAAWLYRYVSLSTALIGAWLWWLALAALVTATLPGAAGVLLVPLTVAVICLFAASLVRTTWPRSLWIAGSLFITVTLTLGGVLPIEQTQGYILYFAAYPFIVLYVIALGPLVRDSGAVTIPVILVVATVVGIIGAWQSPLYSAWRPEQVDIRYVQDTDKGQAWYFLWSRTPPPPRMLDKMSFDREGEAILPWSNLKQQYVASAPVTDWLPPSIAVVSDTTNGDKRDLDLTIQMQRPGRLLGLVLPDAATPSKLEVDGIAVAPHKADGGFSNDRYMLLLTGMGQRPVDIKLELDSAAPFTGWVTDGSTELPATAEPLLAPRPPLASPVHGGDEAILIKAVKF